jgi:DnaA family protein
VVVTRQLSLNIKLGDSSSFENFLAASNREVTEQLTQAVQSLCRQQLPKERVLFLWGSVGTGKTHLLQAACRFAQQAGHTAPVYVPLKEVARLSPAILEELEHVALVCIDDVDRISGDPRWERALFQLCERSRSSDNVLIFSASAGPGHLGLQLPDLATRLGWGLVYQLRLLGDAERLTAIRLRAQNRGLDMTEEVACYVLRRFPRDMHSLFELLERIDSASLASQRRITIPLIRSLE